MQIVNNFTYFFLESRHPNGTYSAVYPDQDTKDKLASVLEKLNCDTPIDHNDFHTTVIYSRKGVPAAKNHDAKMPIKAKFKEWKVFDTKTGSKCLVAVVQSKELDKLNSALMKGYGATSDYPDYTPHITFSYDWKGDIPDVKIDFDIIYNRYKLEALNTNWSGNES